MSEYTTKKCKCGAELPPPKKKIIRCAKCKAAYIYTADLFGNFDYVKIN